VIDSSDHAARLGTSSARSVWRSQPAVGRGCARRRAHPAGATPAEEATRSPAAALVSRALAAGVGAVPAGRQSDISRACRPRPLVHREAARGKPRQCAVVEPVGDRLAQPVGHLGDLHHGQAREICLVVVEPAGLDDGFGCDGALLGRVGQLPQALGRAIGVGTLVLAWISRQSWVLRPSAAGDKAHRGASVHRPLLP
jgi:hypothetical protein